MKLKELTRTNEATVSSDVFGFGVFLLEVACGRRPIELRGIPEERFLIDWVISCWRRNTLLKVVDLRLDGSYVVEKVELILKLGLLCTHCVLDFRPGMGQVIHYLDGNVKLPDIQPDQSGIDILTITHQALRLPSTNLSSHDNITRSPILSSSNLSSHDTITRSPILYYLTGLLTLIKYLAYPQVRQGRKFFSLSD
ncbi:hypothetical protein ACFE04_014390 [Oxalis oulophora]